MKLLPRSVVAIFFAALLPALVISTIYALGNISSGDGYGWVRTVNFAGFALLVSTGHVLFLGLPIFIILKIKKSITMHSSLLAGFVLGCMPVGVWAWPFRFSDLKTSSSHWNGEEMVQTMIEGSPTFAGWLSYGLSVTFMGAFGAIGGYGFWLAWYRLRPNKRMQTDAAKPRR